MSPNKNIGPGRKSQPLIQKFMDMVCGRFWVNLEFRRLIIGRGDQLILKNILAHEYLDLFSFFAESQYEFHIQPGLAVRYLWYDAACSW